MFILHYMRHHAACTLDFDTAREAALSALLSLENNEAWPVRIEAAGGEVVWETDRDGTDALEKLSGT